MHAQGTENARKGATVFAYDTAELSLARVMTMPSRIPWPPPDARRAGAARSACCPMPAP